MNAAASEEESVHQGGFGLEDCSAQQNVQHKFFCVGMYNNNRGRGGGVTGGAFARLHTVALDCTAQYCIYAKRYLKAQSKTQQCPLFLIVLIQYKEKQCPRIASGCTVLHKCSTVLHNCFTDVLHCAIRARPCATLCFNVRCVQLCTHPAKSHTMKYQVKQWYTAHPRKTAAKHTQKQIMP